MRHKLIGLIMVLFIASMGSGGFAYAEMDDLVRVSVDVSSLPSVPGECKVYEARIYDRSMDKFMEAFGMEKARVETDNEYESASDEAAYIIRSTGGTFFYEREDAGALNSLVGFYHDDNYAFDASWIRNHDDLSYMDRDQASVMADEVLQSLGMTDWEVQYEVYPVHIEDALVAIEALNETMRTPVSLDGESDFYYVIAHYRIDELPLEIMDYEMLNEQYVLGTNVELILDENGLRCLGSKAYRVPVSSLLPPEPMLSGSQAIEKMVAYFDDIILSSPLVIKRIDLIYAPYPLHNEQWQIAPVWRFGIAYEREVGSERNEDHIDRFYRVNAYTGAFLE